MKRLTKAVVLLVVMAFLFSLFGCSANQETTTEKNTTTAAPVETTTEKAAETTSQKAADTAAQEATTAPQEEAGNVVLDDLGREVVIPQNAEKYIALSSASMEALINLGVMPIAKIDNYKIKSAAQDLPSVGKMNAVNMEAIYDLKPDVIFAQTRKHAASEEALVKSGAAVFFFDPDEGGNAPIVDLTERFGKIIGKEAEGKAYTERIYAKAKELAAKVSTQTEIKTGLVIIHGDTIKAAINASSFGSMLSLLGVENIVPDGLPGSDKGSFVTFDMETIIAKNPDVIFVMTNLKDKEDNKKIIKSYKQNPLWQDLAAVKNNKIVPLPFKVNPNRASAEEMLEKMAEALLKLGK